MSKSGRIALSVLIALVTSGTAARADAATPANDPVKVGQAPLWTEEFDAPISSEARWVGDRSSAYRYGDHNPDDNKLDWLDRSNVSVEGGIATFHARPGAHDLENGKRAWSTGLLTTEGSAEGFRVRTGDYVETRVRMPSGDGAWPALWTWQDGGNEIDSFEYHPDNPNLLELTNHVRPSQRYHTDAGAISPGEWVTIGTKYGAESVDWYVNGVKVFADGTGVGTSWSAYLILNLSVCSGEYHPAPGKDDPLTFAADYVRVYR
ncbi:glycoside hydrolase family 16 protein [Embleya sp. NPDC001921]